PTRAVVVHVEVPHAAASTRAAVVLHDDDVPALTARVDQRKVARGVPAAVGQRWNLLQVRFELVEGAAELRPGERCRADRGEHPDLDTDRVPQPGPTDP